MLVARVVWFTEASGAALSVAGESGELNSNDRSKRINCIANYNYSIEKLFL